MPRAIGWYSIGIGAGAGLVAIGTSIMMVHQASRRSDNCNAAKVCDPDGVDANQQLSALSPWNIGSYAVAVVGLGLGTILVLTSAKSHREASIEVTPNGSGAGMQLRGTF